MGRPGKNRGALFLWEREYMTLAGKKALVTGAAWGQPMAMGSFMGPSSR